jgi:hypothetical protein
MYTPTKAWKYYNYKRKEIKRWEEEEEEESALSAELSLKDI